MVIMSSRMPRRAFLQAAAIVPATVFGKAAPSNRIQIGQIGCGRIARSSEMPGILRHPDVARVVAVCDLDTVRLADGKEFIETRYTKALGAGNFAPVKTYRDYREMLQDKSIDAVCISTPDHWHAQPAIEAALAGKDIYLQKPASLTIAEGRLMADTVQRMGRILQLGSQQRSRCPCRRTWTTTCGWAAPRWSITRRTAFTRNRPTSSSATPVPAGCAASSSVRA
jgi:hypothetical protein